MITFFITGIPTGTTAYLHTVAVKMVKDTGILMILCFSQVIMGYLMSIFYYNESQNPVCTVGVFFIIAGVVKAIYNKTA